MSKYCREDIVDISEPPEDMFMSDEVSDWENNNYRVDEEDEFDNKELLNCGCKMITGCLCEDIQQLS